MNYYRIAPLNRKLSALVYKSEEALKIGQVAKINIKNESLNGVIIEEVEKPEFETKPAIGENLFFNDNQVALANFIAYYYCVNLGISYGIFTPLDSKLNTKSESINFKNASILSQNQQLALDFINKHKQTLLFGDTGSGKTEIYIHAMIEALKRNQNIVFLLPEISLTPQMEARIKRVFGELVCVWHSKISKKKKSEILRDFNKFKIIMGARSALFLPIENLGLIIVDEEHDDSYKSSSSPTINARDCAIFLSAKRDIKLILGSATPNLNSYYNFKNKGSLFRLKGGHFKSKKIIRFDNAREISPNILGAINKTLENKKQGIIFVPIRANFKTLICDNCASSIMCKNCSLSLSVHINKNALMCHFCGWSMAIPKTCPHCKSESLRALKIGTQEVARELREVFSNANIEIFDRDEIKSDSKLRKILKDFNERKIDILIGTQMLSKGHDYHAISVAVILGIDNLLFANDFRAYERAVSLIFQIAGRCARKDDGEVIIQTKNAEFFKRFLNDYEDFLNYELKNRVDLYPPFARLALICAQHKNDKTAKTILESCKKIVESDKKIEIVGAIRAPIERLGGKWRYFMLLRSAKPNELVNCLQRVKNQNVTIDIDPLHLA